MTFCTTCGKEVPPGMRFCTACGTKNLNKRNLARANLIFFLIALILSVILFFVFRALGGWFMDSLQQYYYYDMSGGLGW